MKRYLAIASVVLAGAVVLAGLAFLVGYWPEHQRRQALEAQASSLQVQLADAQARVRLGGLLGQLLAAEDAVSAQNYGQAQALASAFFDATRAEAAQTAAGSSRDALEKVVQMRDAVTESLTRGDPQALPLLRDAEMVVRDELGFSRPATP